MSSTEQKYRELRDRFVREAHALGIGKLEIAADWRDPEPMSWTDHVADDALRAARDEDKNTAQRDAGNPVVSATDAIQEGGHGASSRTAETPDCNSSPGGMPLSQPGTSPVSAGWPTRDRPARYAAEVGLPTDDHPKHSIIHVLDRRGAWMFADDVDKYVAEGRAALTAAREENARIAKERDAWKGQAQTSQRKLSALAGDTETLLGADWIFPWSNEQWDSLIPITRAAYGLAPGEKAPDGIKFAPSKLLPALERYGHLFASSALRPAAAATREVTRDDIRAAYDEAFGTMDTDGICRENDERFMRALNKRLAAPAAMQRETPTVGSGHLSREYKSDEALKAAGMLPLAQPAARGVVTEAMRKVIGHNWPGNGTRCAWDRKEPCAVTIYYNTEAEAHDAFSAVTVAREDLAGLSEPIQFAPAAPQKASAAS